MSQYVRTFGKFLAVSFIILCFFGINCSAQPSLHSFIETGQNNVYRNGYFSFSVSPSYEFGKNKVDGGILFAFGGQREKNLAACSIAGARSFKFLKQSFNISGYYLWKPFSTELRETNWCIILGLELPHFQFSLGNNYRTYRFSREYIRQNEDLADNSRIVEPWNLIYRFHYSLKKENNPWNLLLSVTDYDYFIIEQATNPVVFVTGTYQFNDNLHSFIDIGYKSAGFMNIEVDHFGYFFRIGLLWEI